MRDMRDMRDAYLDAQDTLDNFTRALMNTMVRVCPFISPVPPEELGMCVLHLPDLSDRQ